MCPGLVIWKKVLLDYRIGDGSGFHGDVAVGDLRVGRAKLRVAAGIEDVVLFWDVILDHKEST